MTYMGRTSDARQRLMSAAHELIWEHSYGAITIDAICERAVVKKGSFYYFFNSKSDLAVAAIEAWWKERKKKLTELFHPDIPPLERIRNHLDFLAQTQLDAHAANGQVLGCPLFTLGAEICTQDERIRALIQSIMTDVMGYVERAIREAQANGDLPGNNSAIKARAILIYYEGSVTRARINNDPEPVRHLTCDVLDLIGATPAVALLH